MPGCENHPVGSGLEGPVCYLHSWGKTEAEAIKNFRAAVYAISANLRARERELEK